MKISALVLTLLTISFCACTKEPINTPTAPLVEVTKPAPKTPTITTNEVYRNTATSAFSGGIITADSGAFVTARGVCWATMTNPTIANSKTSNDIGMGTFSSSITGLKPNTTYYVRAYATNKYGTAYGEELTYAYSILNPNLSSSTATDIDGNVYKIIKIGTQTWMAENLRTRRYRTGELIDSSNVYGVSYSTTPAKYQWKYYDENRAAFDRIYSGYTITDARSIAPTGWHVATDAEWQTLDDYVSANYGSVPNVTNAIAAHSDWLDHHSGTAATTNLSGFSARKGSFLTADRFSNAGDYGPWWTSTANTYRTLTDGNKHIDSGWKDMFCAFPVRCIKN